MIALPSEEDVRAAALKTIVIALFLFYEEDVS
jgi:hypothetical protein